MPWRDDFTKSFWIDPDWVGLSGYPEDQGAPSSPRKPALGKDTITKQYPTYRKREGTEKPLGAAVIVIRDRIGFEYEREVGLGDFVSLREAAQLLELPVMTVSRWVKAKKIKGSKKRGFVVIRLDEVLRIAKERKISPKLGFRLTMIGTAD